MNTLKIILWTIPFWAIGTFCAMLVAQVIANLFAMPILIYRFRKVDALLNWKTVAAKHLLLVVVQPLLLWGILAAVVTRASDVNIAVVDFCLVISVISGLSHCFGPSADAVHDFCTFNKRQINWPALNDALLAGKIRAAGVPPMPDTGSDIDEIIREVEEEIARRDK